MTAPRSTAEYEYHAVPVEDVVYDFEKAFRAGTTPNLETFLVGDGPDRWQLLVELAHSELELRLRAGQPARLSDYLERFPGLAHFPNELAALLVTEVKLRTQAGDGPDLKEYEARYAVLGPRVREAFRKIGAAPPEVPGYDVLDRIAAGGMGVVYRARQLLLQREVALKVIRRDRLAGGEAGDRFRARFRREAQAVAAVNHPNVVQVYETGESDGDLFIAMELVNGPSLQAKLDKEGVLAPAAAAALVEAVARAVDAVHARGIVHRDLKPDNVLVAADGTPKVADFGLARPAEVADGKTKAGVFVGTPEYSSPEQAALTGEDPTPRTDVYGLGAVLYAALTGRPPFPRADLLTTLDRVRTQPVASVRTLRPDVPRDLETVCLKCLGKEPHRRYVTAAALAADLRRFLAGEPVLARPVGRAERGWKWARRNPVVAGLLVAVVASLVGGTVASTVFAVRADENAGRATEKAELARLEAEEKERQRAQADFQRGEAVKEFQRAERERLRVRAALFNTQLLRVQAVCESDPTLATELLNDPLACPPEERDFTWALYARAGRRDLGTLDGQGVVTAVAYSPTGKTLAVASLDGKVRLWDTRTKTVRSTLTGHAGGVLRVAYSPDGRTLATGGNDRTVRLWDARTGEEVAVLGRHGDRVSGVAFSPDGSTLATAGWDGLVKFWDVEARSLAATLRGHTGWVMCVAFSPDGTTLATGGREGEAGVVKLWDVEAKKEVATLNGHKAFVQAVAFSPDGRTMASGGDFTVRLWDVRTRSERAVLDGHGSFVAGVAFSPDGATVASTAMDETVRLWDARSGRPTGVLRGHARLPTAVGFSPDGATLATGDGNLGGDAGSVKLWAVRPPWEKARFRVHDDSVFAVAFHPNGKTVASAGHGHRRLFAPATTFEVWDAATGAVRPEFQGRGRHADAVSGLCYGPDGTTLATASWDGTVKTWAAETGAPGVTCRGHAGWVYAVCFTPDGKTIVSGGQDGTVRLWDAATGAQLRCITSGSGWVHSVAVSPDGRTIGTACDTEIRLFDAATGEPRGVLVGHSEVVNAVCFSPDGATLASAAGGPGKAEKPDHTVRLWDVATLKERAVLKGHGLRVRCVCFSPDGKTLASGDGDLVGRAAVIVWDARSGQQRATLPCDADAVLAVAFSPDSRTLAAGRSDGAVALY